MQSATLRHVLVLAALLVVLGGCTAQPPDTAAPDDPLGTIEVSSSQTIRIGVDTATGFGVDVEGEEIMRGAQLAVEDYGSLHGFDVELVRISSQCSESGGQSTALSFTSDPTIAVVIGPMCAAACEAALPVYEEAHFTVVSPGCGTAHLTDQVTHIDAFTRTIYGDRQEGELAARFAYFELRARKAAIIDDGTAETSDLILGFETTFTSLGGTIAVSATADQGSANFRPALTSIVEADPEVIYAPLLPADAILLSIQKAGAGLQDVPLIGGRRYVNRSFVEGAGYTADGVYAPGPLLASDQYQTVAERYTEEYGSAPVGAQFAFGYDAASLALRSIDEGSALSTGGNLLIGRQAVRDALYSTTTFPGITGTLTCSGWGDCSAGDLAVYRVREGEWVETYILD